MRFAPYKRGKILQVSLSVEKHKQGLCASPPIACLGNGALSLILYYGSTNASNTSYVVVDD